MIDLRLVAGGLAALGGFFLGQTFLAVPEPDPCEMYQEMRQIYEESQGAYGWPEGAIRGCGNGPK